MVKVLTEGIIWSMWEFGFCLKKGEKIFEEKKIELSIW
jgi:hypothetical protein